MDPVAARREKFIGGTTKKYKAFERVNAWTHLITSSTVIKSGTGALSCSFQALACP